MMWERTVSKIKSSKEKKTNQDQSKHGPLKKLVVWSDAADEWASSADRTHPHCALCRNQEKQKHPYKIR